MPGLIYCRLHMLYESMTVIKMREQKQKSQH